MIPARGILGPRRARRPSQSGDDRDAGFTLAEVLVAFVIVSLGAMLALRIGTEAATRSHRLEAVEVVLDEAEGVVMLRAAAGTLHAGWEAGRFSDGRPWALEVAEAGPAIGWRDLPPLWRVRLHEGEAGGRVVYATLVAAGLASD